MTRVRGISGHTRVAIDHGWEVAVGAEPERWIPARVPGTVAGALRAAGEWTWDEKRDFDSEDVWFRAPLSAVGGVLGFDGIATLWEAWLDGTLVASSDSMWERREVAIDHPVTQLVIRCRALAPELAKKRPRPRWKVPMLEQQQLRWIRTTLLGRTPGWSPPCPPVGPWRPVWIEQRTHRVGEIEVEATVDGGDGVVDVVADLPGADLASVVITRGRDRIVSALAFSDGRWRGSVRIRDCALWWPHTHGEPALYALAIDVCAGEHAFEVDVGHTGFRTVFVDQNDDFRARINDVPVFCRGACWTPLDAVTLGASAAQYDAAIVQMRDAGMNMLRVGGTMTYEDDALYDALDAHGVLLWQDLMFANMDYPEDPAFLATVRTEVTAELARLRGRPSLAVVCGNSEVEQQAAMWGAGRERWSPALFHEVIPELVATGVPGTAYAPSSTHGGAFPHASNAGPSSYYGVGAYLRSLDDARRAEVVFASECLGFANVPDPSGLPELSRESHEIWKARVPRDLRATWDFDDVRDHYVQLLFESDPTLRTRDYDRYLDLGRAATGEAMARTFAEWRRRGSKTRGGLVWTLRDLWPGAGWGVIDANGRPKQAWYALRRALAAIAIAFSDEGTNGLVLHACNETAHAITGVLELELWRDGATRAGRGSRELVVGARSTAEVAPTDLLEGWSDLSYAYRFGPPTATVIHARWHDREAFWFPAGLPNVREPDVGLAAQHTGDSLIVSTQRFAQSVMIALPGWLPADDGFHLAPGQQRTIALRAIGDVGPGTVRALNSDAVAPIT